MPDTDEKQIDKVKQANETSDDPARHEADAGRAELVRKQKEQRQQLKDGGTSGISALFGKAKDFLPDLEEAAAKEHKQDVAKAKEASKGEADKHLATLSLVEQPRAERKPDQGIKEGDAPLTPQADIGDTATHLRNRAEFELENIHRGAKYTVSGAAPKVIDYNDSFAVKTQQTPEEVASSQLGRDATPAQKQLYVRFLEEMNKDKLQDDGAGHKVFAAGASIKMPGQTKDGGITVRKGDETITMWNDGSSLVKSGYNVGHAKYSYEGHDVTVSWNSRKSEENKWSTGHNVDVVTTYPDYRSYYERTETTFDAKNRAIQKVYGADEKVPESIRITDQTNTVIDLKPGRDGEFHGQKTKEGQVLDADVGMTATGGTYSRHTDAQGNTVKVFENSTDTLNPKGELISQKISGADQRTITYKYKDGNLESMTIVDKDKNLIEMKPDKTGEMVGTKKNADGKVIDQVGMSFAPLSGGLYSRHETHLGIVKTYENGSTVTTDKLGHVVETTQKDAQGRQVTEKFDGAEKTVTVKSPTDGSVQIFKPGKDGQLHGVKKDASGRVVDSDVGRDKSGAIYSAKTEGDLLVKTYEDGGVQKFDKDGKLIEASGKDKAGRDSVSHYKPDGTLYQIDVKINPGDPPTEFTKTADGKFVHEYKSASGKTLRTVEVQTSDGTLLYENLKNGSKSAVHPDGSMDSESINAAGNTVKVTMRDGESKSVEVHKDANGKEHKLSETFLDPRGYIFHYTYKEGQPDTVTINKPDGFVVLKHTEDGYFGKSTDWFGHTESVQMRRDKDLTYIDQDKGTVRKEAMSTKDGHLVPTLEKVDYDADAGALAPVANSVVQVHQSIAPGRTDLVLADGSTIGTTITGEVSFQNPTGEASVEHPDSEGVRISADGKIEYWDKGGVKQDTLSAHEDSFLKSHPNVDRRDLLEIHRQHVNDKQTLDAFYTQLERLDSTDHLSAAEKASMVKNMMHHVAYPAEIYQGSAPTCNVTTVQRDLAVNHPDKYAKFVADAIVDGEFETASGKTVPLDIDNLKMKDFSRRDLASRVFQTAALNVLRYPKQSFQNTEDGNGQFRPIAQWFGKDYQIGPDTKMGGLQLPEISRIRSELTGESVAPVAVRSVDDLIRVFKENGGKAMTIRVDGNTFPFDKDGPMGTDIAGHVVTLSGVDPGPPVKFMMQNQWGLESDHSSITTMIEAEDLFNNMKRRGTTGEGYVLAKAPDADKYYEAKTGADGSVKLIRTGEAHYDDDGNYVRTNWPGN